MITITTTLPGLLAGILAFAFICASLGALAQNIWQGYLEEDARSIRRHERAAHALTRQDRESIDLGRWR